MGRLVGGLAGCWVVGSCQEVVGWRCGMVQGNVLLDWSVG